VKVVYVGFSANARDIFLFEKIIESGKKQKFKKVRKCEDITE
jgi:predicted solute-binding protein